MEGTRVKVRFVAFVLSNSRHKYVQFQSRPYTALDFVRACKDCFKFPKIATRLKLNCAKSMSTPV